MPMALQIREKKAQATKLLQLDGQTASGNRSKRESMANQYYHGNLVLGADQQLNGITGGRTVAGLFRPEDDTYSNKLWQAAVPNAMGSPEEKLSSAVDVLREPIQEVLDFNPADYNVEQGGYAHVFPLLSDLSSRAMLVSDMLSSYGRETIFQAMGSTDWEASAAAYREKFLQIQKLCGEMKKKVNSNAGAAGI